ncbi:AAA family ATPase [Duganella sp. FT3S]|uniref:AAA family ATPase n=1 Tax=Rugamonas fusca TaxID=2758568 RepID=A0A7W2I574_9BURK|nr:bifunctional aminoglycoside phosphotransferase/ATP-binding protein [Rugamonas fusca]MBA5603965.1 AAA family ATPase [Rugamonas fusca]
MNDRSDLAQQASLVQRLASALTAQDQPCQLFETHISWVLVTPTYAYKIKKAVKFDVLDYSTLYARHRLCEEELRLNRRLAPGIYLDVVPITGSFAQPLLGGDGGRIEYAVRMHAFPQQALWSARLEQGQLDAAEVEALADKLAAFHASAAVAPAGTPWGSGRFVDKAARQDLATVESLAESGELRAQAHLLTVWQSTQERVLDLIAQRKAQGFVRECHGDLHCGNILTLDGKVEVYDCIEFNDDLRWIDVIDDLAFVVMDLRFHGQPGLAAMLLERYLEASGDYSGLAVLGYYLTMRAVVRAKVCLLRARALDGAAAAGHAALARRYLDFAAASVQPGKPPLVIAHGYSGSGKTYYSGRLARALEGIRIRSDVERKRLHGLAPSTRMAAPAGAGIYSDDSTRATYARLLELARYGLRAGLPVVVDASFLQRWQREPFERIARERGAEFRIMHLRAAARTLRARLAQRVRDGRDASDAGPELLARQVAISERLGARERPQVCLINTESGDADRVLAALAASLRTDR